MKLYLYFNTTEKLVIHVHFFSTRFDAYISFHYFMLCISHRPRSKHLYIFYELNFLSREIKTVISVSLCNCFIIQHRFYRMDLNKTQTTIKSRLLTQNQHTKSTMSSSVISVSHGKRMYLPFGKLLLRKLVIIIFSLSYVNANFNANELFQKVIHMPC